MTAYGMTIFCDDIRTEVGNKTTFVGVYRAVLVIPQQFPAVLPKFAMLIMYREAAGTFQDDVTIRVYLPGDSDEVPSFEAVIPFSHLRANSVRPVDMPSDGIWTHSVDVPVILSPLILKEAGWIRVRAICGENVIRLGALNVISRPPPPPPGPSPTAPTVAARSDEIAN